MGGKRMRTSCALVVVLLSVFVLSANGAPAIPSQQKTSATASGKAVRKQTTAAARKQPARDIQGFRIGMGMKRVKQLLARKGVREYESGFSDLLVYAPAYDSEMRLLFTCGRREFVLSNVELSAAFPAGEADRAIATFWDQLTAKYGDPVLGDALPGSMYLCWGSCGQPEGWKLEALTTVPEKGAQQLVVTLGDESLGKICSDRRGASIDRWLDRWIVDALKYSPGMGFRNASFVYGKRYRDRLAARAERDEASGAFPLTNLVAKEFEYFDGLDYDALMFEGTGPGSIILKFTGDEAGAKNPLNQRLYSAFFSTTRFRNLHLGPEMQRKLELFVKGLGKPLETTVLPDRITARWVEGAKQRSVVIEDSGLITFEQSDLALKEAYRDAAVQNFTELSRKRFDRNLF